MADDNVHSCQACGASIYPEHIEKEIAGYLGGRMLCPHCFAETKESLGGEPSAAHSGAVDEEHDEEALRPIAFNDNAAAPNMKIAGHSTGIHGFSGDTLASAAAGILDESKYARPLNAPGEGATRCRTFHAKLNDSAVAFMNDQLNSWVDSHAEITIKYATSTIGIFEGKHSDPNLIITVFY
ncbi:MAG TPA: hypothetical protein VM243_14030 [Phycisphaerae bacterium]|nr:hypothetical protein [Phycisphaerae bacterium]